MKTRRAKRGLTLIELMIAIVAASIVVLTAVMALVMVYESWRVNNGYVALRRDAALASYMIARDVHDSAYAAVTAGSTLTLPSASETRTVVYSRSGADLQFDPGTGTAQTICRQMTGFSSEKVPEGIRVTLALADSGLNIGITNTLFIDTRN